MFLIRESTLQQPQRHNSGNRHGYGPGVDQVHQLTREQHNQPHRGKAQRRQQHILKHRKSHHTVQTTQRPKENRHERRNQHKSRADAHSGLILRSHRHQERVHVHARNEENRSHQRRHETITDELREQPIASQSALRRDSTHQAGIRTEGHERNRNRKQRHQTEKLARTRRTNTIGNHHRGDKRDAGAVHHTQRGQRTTLSKARLLLALPHLGYLNRACGGGTAHRT